MEEFKEFELTIKVSNLKQLQALWLIGNSNVLTEDFLNNHPQKEGYFSEAGNFNNPLSRSWWGLDKKLEPYKSEDF